MNSTPSTFARIMRLTALQPPPPTPMTLIFAGDSSSLKLIRIPVSLPVMRSSAFPNSPALVSRSHYMYRLGRSRCASEHGLQFGYEIPPALRRRPPSLRAVHH